MKNKIIMGLLGIIFLAINILFLFLFAINKNSVIILLGCLLAGFFIYRTLLFLIQKILVKFKIMKYIPDSFEHYEENGKQMRKEANVKYKMKKDRAFSVLIYNIIFTIVMFVYIKFNNKGIITCLIVTFILVLPSLILRPRPYYLWDGYGTTGNIDSLLERINAPLSSKRRKIRATTWDFGGYKETTYRDEDGKKVGRATSFDWGPVTDTTIKDKNGNETKIEHWKL